MNLKKIDRRLATILLIVFVQMLGSAMILPILPLFAKREFALSPGTITLLVSSFFAAQFLAGPVLGRWSDRYGRLPILILSQIGTTISFLMLALAPNAGILFAARILDGITGGNIIVAQAYITDIKPREERTQALGNILAVFGIGFMLGPALGGLLAAAFDARTPYLFAAVAAAITVLLTWLALDESLPEEERQANKQTKRNGFQVRDVLGNQPLILILIIGFVGQFALGSLQATFALYSEEILFTGFDEDATNFGIGLLLAVVGASQFLTQTVILRRMLRRFGERWLIIIGTLIRSLGLFIFIIITTPWLGPFGSFFFAMGLGLVMPALQSLATSTVDDNYRGGVLGIYQSTISLATIVSTSVSGQLFEIEATVPFWVGLILSLLTLIPAVMLLRQFDFEERGKAKAETVHSSTTAD